MKKLFVVFLLLSVSAAFAVNFSPTVMRLSAPATVQYDFDGSQFEIPLTVSGVPATTVFLVHTKDKADNISAIQNGHLGWHYVNKVDTCLYLSSPTLLDVGKHTVIWDGNDNDGGMVPSGEYTYYFWAFDSTSSKVKAYYTYGGTQGQAGLIQEFDENNNPLDNPVYYPPPAAVPQLTADEGGYGGGNDAGINTRAKVVLGGDPDDETLIETTAFSGWGDFGKIALMPGDHDYFFVHNYNRDLTLQIVMKFKYVPNGICEQVMDWADEGRYEFINSAHGLTSGMVSDNISEIWLPIADQSYPSIDNPIELHYIDPDNGSQTRVVDISSWWIDPEEWTKWDEFGHKMHAGPSQMNYRNGHLIGAGLSACYKHMLNPYEEDDDEVTVWMNQNGDYVGDRFFQEEFAGTSKAWMCVGGSGPPWVYDVSLDANLFVISSAYDLGALSFSLFGPDGTGIDYFAFTGETASLKYGQLFVDNGSAFDGIYTDNKSTGEEEKKNGLWYVGHDSITGTITASSVSVEEDAPAVFAVAQNAPNPFNPTTTISFSIAEAGNVSIDVFNVAGQKVDTIVNDFMDAGSHMASWDASGFSAGVYFYTVKTGNYSKTMKMTLLK